jgi:DNA repair exonuclease SbcCD ATPase subunit
MSILDNLKSLVVEQVEIPDSPKTNIIPPTTSTLGSNTLLVNQSVDNEAIKVLDEKIKGKLNAAILAKGPKFYQKMTDLLSTLSEDVQSEPQVYKMALKLLAKDGATPDLLASDLDLCISAIEDNNKAFAENVAKKLNDQIGSRQSNIVTIEQNLSQKNQLIQALQNDIVALTAQRDQEVNLINVETQKTNQSKDRFNIIYSNLHSQLEKQKQNIINYSK